MLYLHILETPTQAISEGEKILLSQLLCFCRSVHEIEVPVPAKR